MPKTEHIGKGFDNSHLLYTIAKGRQLDSIGLCFKVFRTKGENDTNYRERIEDAIKQYNRENL